MLTNGGISPNDAAQGNGLPRTSSRRYNRHLAHHRRNTPMSTDPLLAHLQPQPLWSLFANICAIPHPSGQEQQLRDWICARMSQRGLSWLVDDVGNLIIRKPATVGMEQRLPVILQAHLDMVPQANSDSSHDFSRDPIVPRIEGEWLTASGTTLGADNGIGMAAALAVLESNDIAHGPLEVLLTVNEEAGMDGAFGLKPGLLQGQLLLNTDSEQDGEVYMGCAGGLDARVQLPLSYQPAADQLFFTIRLSGLRGGHSGCDIHRGRANAIKLLARLLDDCQQDCPFALADLQGGTLRNAIPREATATVALAAGDEERFSRNLLRHFECACSELRQADPNLKLALSPARAAQPLLSAESSLRLLGLLRNLPNGVISMSTAIDGVVASSSNLGILRLGPHQAELLCLIRSLDEDGKADIAGQIQALARLCGASVTLSGDYPGWQPNPASLAMTLVRDCHQQLFGTLPNIMVIHAGLECGLFKAAYPHWDMVSFGPTIRFPHSPDERVEIASVARFWQLLVEVLKQLPQQQP